MNRTKQYLILFLIMLAILPANSANAQDTIPRADGMLVSKNPEGTEFWLCFMKNYRPERSEDKNELLLELFITGDKDTEVNIEVKNIGFKQSLFLQAGTVRSVRVDPNAQVQSYEIIEQGAAVKITSVEPISVYGLNRRFQTTDTYLGLPKRVLGTEYRAIGYSMSEGYVSQFAIIATENQTQVWITPAANTSQKPAGETFKVTLNQGDVFQVAARAEFPKKCDLTGSLIKSDKKIAVFSGHQCSYVPERMQACNHLVEQIPPLPSWGKHFYVGKLEPRSRYTYRVLANDDNTKVFEDNKLLKILNGGDFLEREARSNIQVTTDKPVLVAQYSQGFKNGDSIGDPMMLLISPTQQFLKHYRFATPVNGSWNHYVNIVAPTVSLASLRLNGRKLDTTVFRQLGISRYSIGHIRVPFGTHLIDGSMPFGMYSYGFGYSSDAYDAYGTMGGQSFYDYEPTADTLPPTAEMIYADGQQKIIFRDDRVDDIGIKNVSALFSEGIETFIPKIEEGMPQLSVTIKPEAMDKGGRLLLEAFDLNYNKLLITVCWVFNPKTELYEFLMSEGENANCSIDPGYQIGGFLKFSGYIHNTSFSNTDGLITKGTFSDAFGTGGFGGFYIGRRFWNSISLSARLSFDSYGGLITSPDSVISRIRGSDGSLIPFQEAYDLELDGIAMNLAFAAEWYIENYFYLLGGINFAVQLSKSIDLQQRILIPESYTYSNNRREQFPPGAPSNLESIQTLRIGLFGGFGLTQPISYKLSAFVEALYNPWISSIIDDGDWKLQQLSLIAGIKYRM